MVAAGGSLVDEVSLMGSSPASIVISSVFFRHNPSLELIPCTCITRTRHTRTAMALDIDQTKFLEEAMRKVKEQAFYMKHAMVSFESLANELPAFCTWT